MTPTATTGGNTRSGRDGSGDRSATHRPKLRRQPAPRPPRRVSGPVGGLAGPGLRGRNSARVTARRAPLGARALAFMRSLPDHAVIDRLVRGRAWILALGVMLAGIVAMQVEVLKLGASIGRSVQRSSALSIRNAELQASVASLADDQRIERLAAGMGMVMAPPAAVAFLPAGAEGNIHGALGNIRAPDPTTFFNSTSTNGIVVTPTSLAAANAPLSSSSAATPNAAASASLGAGTVSPGGSSSGAGTVSPRSSSSVASPTISTTSAAPVGPTVLGGSSAAPAVVTGGSSAASTVPGGSSAAPGAAGATTPTGG